MERILITGSNGLLGQKLVILLAAKKKYEILAVSKNSNKIETIKGYDFQNLDITDHVSTYKIIKDFKPGFVFNTAAITQVDQCKQDKPMCKALNVDAVENLVNCCNELNSHLIHLSTDFVFDGKNGPYKEDDQPNPLSFYAKSKLDSEKLIQQSNISWTIIRTILVYGLTYRNSRPNFVTWVKESLEKNKNINVVTDHIRMPTLAEDLANGCYLAMLHKAKGMYHISGKDMVNMFEFAQIVADTFELDKSLIHPVLSDTIKDADPRPPKTGFILEKSYKNLNYKPHSIYEGLQIIKKQYINY